MSDRDMWERALTRSISAAVSEFAAQIEEAARDSITDRGSALIAAGGSSSPRPHAFTLGKVARRWQDSVVPVLMDAVEKRAPSEGDGALFDRFVRHARQRLQDSGTPADVFDRYRRALMFDAVDQTSDSLNEAISDVSEDHPPSTLARLLAREFATPAYGFATIDRLKAMGHTRKRWISHVDDRVRATHLHANGQEVSIDEPFLVGGFALQVPGDLTAPASETSRCRCVLIGLKDDDEDAVS